MTKGGEIPEGYKPVKGKAKRRSGEAGIRASVVDSKMFTPPAGSADWMADLLTDGKGKPLGQLANVLKALRTAPEWSGVIGYSEFDNRIWMLAPPPWLPAGTPFKARLWEDVDDTLTVDWMQRQGIGANEVTAAVIAAARDNAFHPVRDYLSGLKWDRRQRADQWLSIFLGVEPSDYTAAIGRRFLIAAVARIFAPGAKVDAALVLEGQQGIGKTRAIEILAGAWYAAATADVGTKDFAMEVAGCWVMELGEMAGFRGQDVERIKATISKRSDRFRPAYGRYVIDAPRQLVFIGTTNDDAYLRDATGGRRFWPAMCQAIDLEALERERDQLWAEAVHLYRGKQPWWLDDPDLVQQASAQQDARYSADAWEDPIAQHLVGLRFVTIEQLLSGPLAMPRMHQDQRAMNRVSKVMRRLGWRKIRKRTSAGLAWGFEPGTGPHVLGAEP